MVIFISTANGSWRSYVIGSVCLSLCLDCQQDYSKSAQLISRKLRVMVGLTSGKNRLTFGVDPVPDHFLTALSITECGSLGDLLAFHIFTFNNQLLFYETQLNQFTTFLVVIQ